MTVPYNHKTKRSRQPEDPYLALATGVLVGAVNDVARSNKRAPEARRWLASDDCAAYLEALDINSGIVQRWLDQHNQPAKAGLTKGPLRTNGKEKYIMTEQTDTFKAGLDQLDEEGQAELNARMDGVMREVLANQNRRKPTPARQAELRSAYQAEVATGPTSQKVIIRAKYRRMGLNI